MVFSPLVTALITPFTEKDTVDVEALTALVQWQERSGIKDLLLLGSTGEAQLLTYQEREVVLKTAAVARSNARIIVGCTAFTPQESARFAKQAEFFEADAILLAPPPYSKPSQQGIIDTATYVMENCSLPLFLYTIPSRTGVHISVETVQALAAFPRIIGIKDASGSLSYSQELLNKVPSSFLVYSGDDASTLPLLSLGACGTVSVASNLLPQTCRQLFSLPQKQAAALHNDLFPLFTALFCAPNPTVCKAVAQMLGLCRGSVRLPLLPPSEEILEHAFSAFEQFRQSAYYIEENFPNPIYQ